MGFNDLKSNYGASGIIVLLKTTKNSKILLISFFKKYKKMI